jgi:hypothetical protein
MKVPGGMFSRSGRSFSYFSTRLSTWLHGGAGAVGSFLPRTPPPPFDPASLSLTITYKAPGRPNQTLSELSLDIVSRKSLSCR